MLEELPSTLTHVYQEEFGNGYSLGIGDFIRGSIFVLQFCKLHGIPCEITFKNHQLSKFLNVSNATPINDLSIMRDKQPINATFYKMNGEIRHTVGSVYDSSRSFINYWNRTKSTCVNTNFYPMYPDMLVEHKAYMKTLLEPTESIKQIALDEIRRMKLNNYKIIHVRCGDAELIHNIINNELHETILTQLDGRMDDRTLVLSDSSTLKQRIKMKYPRVHIVQNTTKHIGEGVVNAGASYVSLLVDMFFISLSTQVVSLSTLNHGSGFAEWISKIYDIPYQCLYVQRSRRFDLGKLYNYKN